LRAFEKAAKAEISGVSQARQAIFFAEILQTITKKAALFSDFISKPFGFESLVTALEKCLHRAGRLKTSFAGPAQIRPLQVMQAFADTKRTSEH
jgi:hypothetical protein